MRIIDRYLLRQFLQTFVICFCSLDGLFVVFDAFSNLDEFLRHAENGRSVVAVMGEFYAYRSIFIFERTSAVLSVIAAMFTVTWIQRHNELTALVAAGIPRTRVIRPIVAAVVVISLVAVAGREWLIPQFRDELSRHPRDLRGESGQPLRPRYDNETNILLRGQLTYAADQRIARPNFLLPPGLDGHGRQLLAENAYYQPADGNRRAGYLLRSVSQPKGLALLPSLPRSGRRTLITPQDEPKWLGPDECFVVSNVSFEQLSGGRGWRQFSSTADLIRGLTNRSLDFGADVRVAIHGRMVQPILDLTLLYLGLPLVLGGYNRNVFVAVGLCAAICATFMLVIMACQHLGTIYLIDPVLAAWVPVMIFVPAAALLYDQFER